MQYATDDFGHRIYSGDVVLMQVDEFAAVWVHVSELEMDF